jgi:hypothetical protein
MFNFWKKLRLWHKVSIIVTVLAVLLSLRSVPIIWQSSPNSSINGLFQFLISFLFNLLLVLIELGLFAGLYFLLKKLQSVVQWQFNQWLATIIIFILTIIIGIIWWLSGERQLIIWLWQSGLKIENYTLAEPIIMLAAGVVLFILAILLKANRIFSVTIFLVWLHLVWFLGVWSVFPVPTYTFEISECDDFPIFVEEVSWLDTFREVYIIRDEQVHIAGRLIVKESQPENFILELSKPGTEKQLLNMPETQKMQECVPEKYDEKKIKLQEFTSSEYDFSTNR